MEFESSKKYLNILFDHIFELLFVHQFGVNHAEHVFYQILQILKRDEKTKEWFFLLMKANLLSNEIDCTKLKKRPTGFIDPDLICYIAHATRWPEFRLAALERSKQVDKIKKLNTQCEYSDMILSALEDEWDEKDFYLFL